MIMQKFQLFNKTLLMFILSVCVLEVSSFHNTFCDWFPNELRCHKILLIHACLQLIFNESREKLCPPADKCNNSLLVSNCAQKRAKWRHFEWTRTLNPVNCVSQPCMTWDKTFQINRKHKNSFQHHVYPEVDNMLMIWAELSSKDCEGSWSSCKNKHRAVFWTQSEISPLEEQQSCRVIKWANRAFSKAAAINLCCWFVFPLLLPSLINSFLFHILLFVHFICFIGFFVGFFCCSPLPCLMGQEGHSRGGNLLFAGNKVWEQMG